MSVNNLFRLAMVEVLLFNNICTGLLLFFLAAVICWCPVNNNKNNKIFLIIINYSKKNSVKIRNWITVCVNLWFTFTTNVFIARRTNSNFVFCFSSWYFLFLNPALNFRTMTVTNFRHFKLNINYKIVV